MTNQKSSYPPAQKNVDVGVPTEQHNAWGNPPLGQHPPSEPLRGIDAAWETPGANTGPLASSYDGRTPSVTAPISRVGESVRDNVHAADHLHELITELEGRLSAVLGPEDEDAGCTKAPRAPQSPLVDQLEDLRDQQRRANLRLQALITRIEV